jgi:hypothetical protein
VFIDGRFNGPPASANGGYACGVIAAAAAEALGGPVAVTLVAPPPLDTSLRLSVAGRRAHVFAGDELVATAAVDASDVAAPDPVALPLVAQAEAAFTGAGHPFPTCFVCGTSRTGDDGMGLRPGPVPGRPSTVACRWIPDAVAPELVWAALDCPGGWTDDPAREAMVLGRMVALIDELPQAGRPYVLVGQRVDRNGRTATNITALYDEDGGLLARAAAIWVAVS